MNLHEAYRDFENLPQLRPDEKESPFAKFYYVPVEMPAPEILEGIDADKPMDPEKAIGVDEVDRLFKVGYDEVENGWCVMPDGTGYSAVRVELPDVTAAELMQFQVYGHMNNLQYKTWLPKLHLQQGDFTIENFGWGPLLFHQRQLMAENGMDPSMVNPEAINPQDLARLSMKVCGVTIEDPKALDPDFVAIVGGPIYTIDVLTGDRNDLTMITYMRKKNGGLELRVRVWLGMHNVGGRAVRRIPEGTSVDPMKVLAIATHNAFEWTRANTIARDVCQLIDAIEDGEVIKQPSAETEFSACMEEINVSGKWKLAARSPMGEQEMRFDLTQSGSSLSGTMTAMGQEVPINDGIVNGNTLRFTVKVKGPIGKMKFRVSAEVEGDTIKGTSKAPMGSMTFEGTRL